MKDGIHPTILIFHWSVPFSGNDHISHLGKAENSLTLKVPKGKNEHLVLLECNLDLRREDLLENAVPQKYIPTQNDRFQWWIFIQNG